MTYNPIIPIYIMIIISVVLIVLSINGRSFSIILHILIVVVLFAINLRPVLPEGYGDKYTTNLDIMFVIDNTISMDAEDVAGRTRMTALKEDCQYIVKELAGSSFSIVTFSNYSQIVIPYTYDLLSINTAIKTINTKDIFYAQGSNLGIPKDAINYLKENHSAISEDVKQIIIFISDGEETNGKRTVNYKDLKDYFKGGVVLGYGTKEGGKMKYSNHSKSKQSNMQGHIDSNGYLLDNSVNPPTVALSKLDEGNLQAIAEEFGVPYIHATDRKAIDKAIEEIVKIKEMKETDEEAVTGVETYYYLAILLLGLLFLELIDIRKRRA